MNSPAVLAEYPSEGGLPGLPGPKKCGHRRPSDGSSDLVQVDRPLDHDTHCTVKIRSFNPNFQPSVRAKPPEATRENLRKCGDFAPIRAIPFDPAPDLVVHLSHRNRSGR